MRTSRLDPSYVTRRGLLTALTAALLVGLGTNAEAGIVLSYEQAQPGDVQPVTVFNSQQIGQTVAPAPAFSTFSAVPGGVQLVIPIIINTLNDVSGLAINAFAIYQNVQSSAAGTANALGITQEFDGTIAINSAADGTGLNYLTTVFEGVAFTVQTAGTILASTPPAISVVFTSDLFGFSNSTLRSMNLGFLNIQKLPFPDSTPGTALGLVGGSVESFRANNNIGTFEADVIDVVPEPSTLLSSGLALTVILGWAGYRRRSFKPTA
jgi:hypothetical protein